MGALFDSVCDPVNLLYAWQKVRGSKSLAARQRGAGVDGVTLAAWDEDASTRLHQIHEALLSGTYRASPLLWFDVPRQSSGASRFGKCAAPVHEGESSETRRLGIPTVTDRVAQRAVLNVLEPLWEPVFLSCSHGYRPNHSVFTAVSHVLWYRMRGLTWVLDADIANYFNTVCHAILQDYLAPLGDARVLALLVDWLDVGASHPGYGLAQGAVISPLLANIYLHAFDIAMVEAGLALVRYADDFVILCTDLAQAQHALVQAADALAALGLSLNSDKTTIVEFGPDFEFLGAQFYE